MKISMKTNDKQEYLSKVNKFTISPHTTPSASPSEHQTQKEEECDMKN